MEARSRIGEVKCEMSELFLDTRHSSLATTYQRRITNNDNENENDSDNGGIPPKRVTCDYSIFR